MDKKKRERMAMFRFGIIFPLLDERLGHGERAKRTREICQGEYEIPGSGRRKVSPGTVRSWYYAYRKGGMKALEPKERSDSGESRSLDDETMAELVRRRVERPDVPLTAVVRAMEEEGHAVMGMSSVYRAMREWDREHKGKEEKDRRRFEAESCNDLWITDAMVLSEPRVVIDAGGARQRRRGRCFAFLDDRSRMVTNARFYADESAESLLDCMWGAMNMHGLPRRIYTDNGAAMRDRRLQRGLAELEVELVYARPYQPQGKAKLERFWKTLREQFVPTLPGDELTLHDLNTRLDRYIRAYNRRYHSGIGMSPDERYFSEVQAVRPAPRDLPSYFRASVERTVSSARTVQLDGTLYEVPIGYSGRKLELRYFRGGDVEAFYEGRSLGYIHPVDLRHNALCHRQGKEAGDGKDE